MRAPSYLSVSTWSATDARLSRELAPRKLLCEDEVILVHWNIVHDFETLRGPLLSGSSQPEAPALARMRDEKSTLCEQVECVK